MRICDCWCAGKMSMMRLTDCAAEWVCSVANVRWPVSATQGLGEPQGIAEHLALVDEAALVRVQVLDRVLDGEDVLRPLHVDLVDEGGQRGGLAAARGPRHQHQPPRPLGQRRNHGRQPEFPQPTDLLRDQTEDGPHGAPLAEDVAAEPREAPDPEREVELELLLEPLLLRVAQHAVDEALGVGRRQVVGRQPLEFAVDPDLGRRPARDVEVRRPHLEHPLQQFRQRRHQRLRRRARPRRYPTVSRRTSSMVVTPSLILRRPLWRRVSMPSSMALRRSSSPDAPTRISSLRESVTSMTS